MNFDRYIKCNGIKFWKTNQNQLLVEMVKAVIFYTNFQIQLNQTSHRVKDRLLSEL